MANPRLPDNVHVLRGTYKKHRHGDPKEKPAWSEQPPTMPKCVSLNSVARAEWNRALKDAPPGVITQTDRMLLAQYALLSAQLQSNPYEFTAADHTQLRLIQQELGFTPCSRGKIANRGKSKESSGFE